MTNPTDANADTDARHCPRCDHELTQVGAFWICPDHGDMSGEKEKKLEPLRIFLSYGHDDNQELVLRIKGDLEGRGHDVWLDKSEIRTGDDWRRSITDGIVHSQRVISFLSKHSTRDPGVCRDELAIAVGVKGGNIQTVLVESEQEVQPPQTISHIQWLDMHDWKERKAGSENTWESWYQSQLGEIVRVIESDESRRFAGEIEDLAGLLKPIRSDARICGLLNKGFYGREWLFDAVENWRTDGGTDSRLFWIMGAPGVGKSAFAAQLTHMRGDTVIAAQFCEWDKPDHRDARRVVRSIAFQLATRLPDYRKLIRTLPEIKELDQKKPEELFEYLLTNPLQTAIKGGRQRYLILIDALDEASESGRNPLVDILARQAKNLPEWLGIVVTSRPEFDVRTPFQGLNPYPLDTDSESNRDDLRTYLGGRLGPLLTGRPDAAQLTEQILEKSEGVFLYVERFCHDVHAGHLSLEHPEKFPQGLGGIFVEYFQRQFPDLDDFRKRVRPALRAVLAAREPLPVDVLQDLFDWQVEELNDFVIELGSLFPVSAELGEKVIKPYHKSLADWLTDDSKAGPYFVSLLEGHKTLANYFLGLPTWEPAYRAGKTEGAPAGRYPVRRKLSQLCYQLAHARMADEYVATLTDFQYLLARVTASGPRKLEDDYEQWGKAGLPVGEDRRSLTLIEGAVRLSAHVLEQHNDQLASQLFARLGPEETPLIQRLLEQARSSNTDVWLRPLSPCLTSPGGPLIRRLEGHSDSVHTVVVTPDGRRAVSGSSDKTLIVWDLESGRELRTLKGHSNSVWAVAVTADGQRVISGSWDKTIIVWDLESGRKLRQLEGHSDFVKAVAVTPNGRCAISASNDTTLVVWDLGNGQKIRTLEGHSNSVVAVAVTPDGRRAISGSSDKTLAVWDLESGERLLTLSGHVSFISSLAVTPDAGRVISGSYGRNLAVWDLATARRLRSITAHPEGIYDLALTPDGRQAISGSSDRTLAVWDLDDSRCLRTLKGHSGSVNTVAVAPDGRRAISGSSDKSLIVWDLESKPGLHTRRAHSTYVHALAVTPDGRRVVSGSKDATLAVWSAENGQRIQSLEGHTSSPAGRAGFSNSISAVAITPDGRRAVSASYDETVAVWDLETGQRIHTLEGHSRGVESVAVTPDCQRVVSGSWDNTLIVWDLKNGQKLHTLEGHSDNIFGLTVTPDGRRAVSASEDNTLMVWDLETGRRLHILDGHIDDLRMAALALGGRHMVAVAPNGRHAVSASKDKALVVWDLETGRRLRRFEAHTSRINAVAVTPDGRYVVSGSGLSGDPGRRDGEFTVAVWDLHTGRRLHTLEGHTELVKTVAVTPNGRYVVSGAHDKTLAVWNLENGELLCKFHAEANLYSCVCAGSTIVAGDSAGNVLFFALEGCGSKAAPGSRTAMEQSTAVTPVAAEGCLPPPESIAARSVHVQGQDQARKAIDIPPATTHTERATDSKAEDRDTEGSPVEEPAEPRQIPEKEHVEEKPAGSARDINNESWIGQYIGDMRIVRELNRGSTGVVFLAENTLLKRPVAVKIIDPVLASRPGFAEGFLDEHRIGASRLSHPNIISVFGKGRLDDGTLFLAMEHIEGAPLSYVVAEVGQLPWRRAAHVLRQILEALTEAHRVGVAHGNLEPENILLGRMWGRDDTVKIADFELASAIAKLWNTTVGTLAHLAPELLSGQAPNHGADIYSAAAIGYLMLAGRPPFVAEDTTTLAFQIMNETPRPLSSLYPRRSQTNAPTLLFDIHQAGRVAETTRVERDIIKIGKLPTCHLRVEDPSVSGIHAVIEVVDGVANLVDLGSANGTNVNGKRINRYQLNPGDEIQFGSVKVVFRMEEAPPNLPTELEEVIHRGLAKSPDDRHPTAKEMLAALDRIQVADS